MVASSWGTALDGSGGAAGLVPEEEKHLTRYPFIFLVDVSASTGFGEADADIHKINQALTDIFAKLRVPDADSELADRHRQVDVCVITYSDSPIVEIDWTTAPNLPSSVMYEPRQATNTLKALVESFALIQARLKYYRDPSNNIPSPGLAHIFHITDGAPTDLPINSPDWHAVRKHLANLAHGKSGERRDAVILHFVAPNGCRITDFAPVDETGKQITGQEYLARLSKPQSVYRLTEGAEAFKDLITLVTHVITKVTQVFAYDPSTALSEAKNLIENSKSNIIRTQPSDDDATPADL